MLTPVPNPLRIDIKREVPDFLRGVDGVGVVGVHDPGVVEDDVEAAPGVEVFDCGGYGGLRADVADEGFEAAWGGGAEFFQFCEGFFEGGGGDIGEEDGGAFAREEDACF